MKGSMRYVYTKPRYSLAKAEEELQVIIKSVTYITKVDIEKIKKRRGKVEVSNARNLICYLGMKRKLGAANIGKVLGDREHSTISFNSIAFKGHIETDQELLNLLQRVQATLPDGQD